MRELLQKELERRVESNPNYSIRAFARFLEIDHSRLAKILKGTRPISNDLADKLAQKLNLTEMEVENFKLSKLPHYVDSEYITKKKKYLELSLDHFEIISDWRHYAILELMKYQSFEADSNWIAEKLNSTEEEINSYIERLQRVNLLVIKDNGEWVDTSEGSSTHVLDKNVTSKAHKRYQEDMLKGAITAMNEIDITKRDQSSMMMATSTQKIDQAKDMIEKFRRELCAFLEDTNEQDSLYQLGISLYPLDQSEGEKR